MKKVIGLLCCLALTFALVPAHAADRATYPDYSIVISNISGTNPSASSPSERNSITVTGKAVDGYTMIKINDLAYIGATISFPSASTWKVVINGQTITFTKDSKNYTSLTSYSVYDPATGTKPYSVSFSGTSNIAAMEIDGEKYVQLTHAGNQAGALQVAYFANLNLTKIFHWRVNSYSAYSDPNSYIVGGPWLTSWSSKGTTQIAPHFKINEFWDDDSNAATAYAYQVKMSVTQLAVAENVRYNYNNNSSMQINSGFRGWTTNGSTTGAWAQSFHMRGRAWDAQNTNSIYTKVFDEFRAGQATPIDSFGGSYWRTRVTDGKSGGYEIEKMPSGGGTWLHMMTKPAASDGTC